ncbi:MAG: hypothetical protein F4010_05775 [Cenarchaeum sp. SB0669_bin_11]|nr:hypothetical protein [Cenarchaeum sp. SB0675_bin_21]MYL11640.1 hypothetical protein [Cenarchaeum sp. SB0669_bin_11]
MDTPNDMLKTLYGHNPDMYNTAFQFPRLPPAALKRIGINNDTFYRLGDDILSADFETFRAAFLERANALTTGSATVPPGHPLSSGRRLLNSVIAERDKLQKENQELREQLKATPNTNTPP